MRSVAPEEIEVTLSGRWRLRAALEGRLVDHVRLRLGERSLTAHLDDLPVLDFLLPLAAGLSALLRGEAPRCLVPLADHHFELTRRADRALLDFGWGERAVVREAPVELASLRASLLHVLRVLVDAEPPIEEAERAALDAAHAELAESPEQPRPIRRRRRRRADGRTPVDLDAGRVRFGFERLAPGADRVRPWIRLGVRTFTGDPIDPEVLALVVVEGAEELLHAREWGPTHGVWPLDARGDRRFRLRRADEGSSAAVVDPGDHPIAPPVTVRPRALIEAAHDLLSALRGGFPDAESLPRLNTQIRRLARWARALDAGDRRAESSHPPDGWRPIRAPRRRRPAAPPLPVSGLQHLAYRRIWRREAPGLEQVVTGKGRLLVFDAEGLRAFDAATGAPCWSAPGLRPLDRAAPPGFALDRDGALVRVDPATGVRMWRSRREQNAPPWQVRRVGHQLITCGPDHVVRGLDPDTGRWLWRYATLYGAVLRTGSHGPMLWLTAEDGFLHAVEASAGRARFVVRLDGEPDGPPRPTPHGLLVGTRKRVGSAGTLLALDPLRGDRRWLRGFEGPLLAGPESAGETVVVAVDAGIEVAVCAVNLRDGELRWRTALPRRPLTPTDPVPVHPPTLRIIDDAVYLKRTDGRVAALALADGALRWTLDGDDPDDALVVNAPVVPCRGVLLVPGTRIRAVDPASGRVAHVLDCGELVPRWMHVWPEGDLVIAEDDAVARYLLGGHLALVA